MFCSRVGTRSLLFLLGDDYGTAMGWGWVVLVVRVCFSFRGSIEETGTGKVDMGRSGVYVYALETGRGKGFSVF